MLVRFLIFFYLLIGFVACNSNHPDNSKLQSSIDSVSYALGADIARYYQEQNLTLNPDLIYQGFRDKNKNNSLIISEKEIEFLLDSFATHLDEQNQLALAEIAEENQRLQQEFLEQNQQKEDVSILPSGLQYRILDEGAGRPPKLDNRVRVKYEGKLLDGEYFTPMGERDLELSEMIPGLQEVLTLMRPGDHWEVFVPSDLAWGTQDRAQIPPNSLLIFDLTMIEIL